MQKASVCMCVSKMVSAMNEMKKDSVDIKLLSSKWLLSQNEQGENILGGNIWPPKLHKTISLKREQFTLSCQRKKKSSNPKALRPNYAWCYQGKISRSE